MEELVEGPLVEDLVRLRSVLEAEAEAEAEDLVVVALVVLGLEVLLYFHINFL
jgi:hypothetical protein